MQEFLPTTENRQTIQAKKRPLTLWTTRDSGHLGSLRRVFLNIDQGNPVCSLGGLGTMGGSTTSLAFGLHVEGLPYPLLSPPRWRVMHVIPGFGRKN